MRPFFPYLGSKWRGAKRYGPPRRGRVIEPFAGSACYSTWWEAPKVDLYDVSDSACAAWDWLIGCSAEDVRRVPLKFRSNDEWAALPDGPRQIVFWHLAYGRSDVGDALPEWFLRWCRTGELTGPVTDPLSERIWGERARDRIVRQKPKIRNWSIDRKSYADIETSAVDAHWHVDPPYQGPAGRRYEHSDIDYAHLAEWCRNLPGAVDVCEHQGADWLPFEPLYAGTTANSAKQCTEVVWRNAPVDLTGLMSD